MKKFGINTLEDLPELPNYKMDENRQIVIDDILEGQEKDRENAENKEIEKEDAIEEAEKLQGNIEDIEAKETNEKGEDDETWKMI